VCCNNVCINSQTHGCCKYTHLVTLAATQVPYTLYNEKCCPRDGVKSWNEQCLCSSSSHCPDAHGRGETSCCIRNKLHDEASSKVINGTCHNPTVQTCCQTSVEDFDALIDIEEDKDQQRICCKNVGIIPAGDRCPCSEDGDCDGSGQTCCFDKTPQRYYWRKGAGGILGLPPAPVGSLDEYGDTPKKCTRGCRTTDDGNGGNGPFNCKGQCVSAPKGDTCCSDGHIAENDNKCCQVKPAKFNKNTFSASFTLFQSYNDITQYCCPRGAVASNSYLIPIPELCTGNPMNNIHRCACDTDADCQTGGTCCGGRCTIAAAKEKCCSGFDTTEQDPVIIREDQTCCPLVPMGVNAGDLCPCAADKHCPSGKTCCNGGSCFTSVERCDHEVLHGGSYGGACRGVCINTEHDKCCGTDDSDSPVVCKSKFQKCCGENTNMASCCYKHNEICHKTKPLEGDPKYFCSVSMQPSHAIIFHAIVFPIILTFVLIAIYLVALLHGLKHSQSNRSLTLLTIGFGVLVLLLSLLLLWSMLWKFSVVAIIGNAAILSALGASSQWHRRIAGLLAFIALLYVVDPFTGHSFLSFHWTGVTTHEEGTLQTSGLQDAAKANWKWGDTEFDRYNDVQPQRCAEYYQWFYVKTTEWNIIKAENQYDSKYDEHRRFWGICTLGWVHAINIISGLLVIFQILVSAMGLYLIAKHGHDEVENFEKPKSAGKVAPVAHSLGNDPPIEDPSR
jgi:hypothetical protein